MIDAHRRDRPGNHPWAGLVVSGYLAVTAVAVVGFGSWFAWTAVRDGALLSGLGAAATLTAAASFAWLSRWLVRQLRATPSPSDPQRLRPGELDSFAVVGGMLDGAVYTRSARRRWPGRAVVVFLACCFLFMFAMSVSQAHWGGVATALVIGPCWLIVSGYAFGAEYVPVIDEGVATVIDELERAYDTDVDAGE